MLIDKYNRIDTAKLPKDIVAELDQIKTDTDNFKDTDLVDVYADNFNTLYDHIQAKYPQAIKPKPRLKKGTAVKLVKKKAEKRAIVKKAAPAGPKKQLIKKKDEPIGATGKDYDLSALVGKRITWHFMGQSDSPIAKIESIRVTGKEFEHRNVIIVDSQTGSTEKFPLAQLENFLEGKQINIKGAKEDYAIELLDKADDDCATALATIKAIETKKEQAATKRSDAPTRKASDVLVDKVVKSYHTALKTKAIKHDPAKASKLAADLVKTYRTHVGDAVADKIHAQLTVKKKLIKKAERGAQLKDVPTKVGQIVKYRQPLDDEDENQTFEILEIDRDRVLMKALGTGMEIEPTERAAVSVLKVVKA